MHCSVLRKSEVSERKERGRKEGAEVRGDR